MIEGSRPFHIILKKKLKKNYDWVELTSSSSQGRVKHTENGI